MANNQAELIDIKSEHIENLILIQGKPEFDKYKEKHNIYTIDRKNHKEYHISMFYLSSTETTVIENIRCKEGINITLPADRKIKDIIFHY